MTTDEDELAALRQENRILRDTLDTIDGTVVVYDADHRYVLGNRAYHEFFPHLPDEAELIGLRYEEVLAKSIAAGTVADQAAYRDPIAYVAQRTRALEARTESPREIHNSSTGQWHLLRVRHTEAGHRVALRVDITEQKRMQQALNEAREAAEVANRAKSRFLAHVSHELRAPLNAVINFAHLIEETVQSGRDPGPTAAYARDIRESGEHLRTLIDELLDLARAEAGQLKLTDGPMNLRGLILSVCRMMQPDAANGGMMLLVDVPQTLPDLHADSQRLRQVLFNLLSNAIKFSAPGAQVQVSATSDQTGVTIRIRDTGCGIASEDLPRVMLPFERVTNGPHQAPGIGLGLPLTAHLVALHDGQLTFDSRPGEGTTVAVTLPPQRVLKQALQAA